MVDECFVCVSGAAAQRVVYGAVKLETTQVIYNYLPVPIDLGARPLMVCVMIPRGISSNPPTLVCGGETGKASYSWSSVYMGTIKVTDTGFEIGPTEYSVNQTMQFFAVMPE